jgi:hypothetical protein
MGTEIPNAMAKLLNLAEAANDDVAAPALADDLDGVAVVVVMIRRTFPLPLLIVVLFFNSSGAVAGWQFARSVLNTKRSTRHQNPPSETGSRRGASVANFRTRRPAHICRMPPCCWAATMATKVRVAFALDGCVLRRKPRMRRAHPS